MLIIDTYQRSNSRFFYSPVNVFIYNPFDGHTIESFLNQLKTSEIYLPKELVYDRGSKGKTDFRMQQNNLWGEKGIQINALMAATAWNFKKMMEELKKNFLQLLFRFFFSKNFLLSHQLKKGF